MVTQEEIDVLEAQKVLNEKQYALAQKQLNDAIIKAKAEKA